MGPDCGVCRVLLAIVTNCSRMLRAGDACLQTSCLQVDLPAETLQGLDVCIKHLCRTFRQRRYSHVSHDCLPSPHTWHISLDDAAQQADASACTHVHADIAAPHLRRRLHMPAA